MLWKCLFLYTCYSETIIKVGGLKRTLGVKTWATCPFVGGSHWKWFNWKRSELCQILVNFSYIAIVILRGLLRRKLASAVIKTTVVIHKKKDEEILWILTYSTVSCWWWDSAPDWPDSIPNRRWWLSATRPTAEVPPDPPWPMLRSRWHRAAANRRTRRNLFVSVQIQRFRRLKKSPDTDSIMEVLRSRPKSLITSPWKFN